MRRNNSLVVILIIIILILVIALTGAIIYIYMDKDNETSNNLASNNINQSELESSNEVGTGDVIDDIKQMEIDSFNAIYESYEGTERSASQIKALLSQIEINNTTTDNERKIILNNTGVTNSQEVDNEKKYNVELSYDDEGYINEIKITDSAENTTGGNGTTGDMEKLIFNTTFTPYLGDITGTELNALLQKIQESNGNNPDHVIVLSSNNLQNLNGIVATDTYTITLSYGADGYVSNINIDKK